jgi:hypothetical protein
LALQYLKIYCRTSALVEVPSENVKKATIV